MNFLFLLIFSCMPKVSDLEPTGSVCIDAIQLNLIRDGCKLVNTNRTDFGLEMVCVKSKNGGEWTKKIFHVTHPEIGIQQLQGFHPICIDKDIIVHVSHI